MKDSKLLLKIMNRAKEGEGGITTIIRTTEIVGIPTKYVIRPRSQGAERVEITRKGLDGLDG